MGTGGSGFKSSHGSIIQNCGDGSDERIFC